MYTAEQARNEVKLYEEKLKQQTLENLLENPENQAALEIFEDEIFKLASIGNTQLPIHKEDNLFKLFKNTDISLILRYLGYSISSDYANWYKICW